MAISPEAIEELESIRRNPGLYTGLFDEAVVRELVKADLVERYYDGPGAILGLSKLRIKSA